MKAKKREKLYTKATWETFDAPMMIPHLSANFLFPFTFINLNSHPDPLQHQDKHRLVRRLTWPLQVKVSRWCLISNSSTRPWTRSILKSRRWNFTIEKDPPVSSHFPYVAISHIRRWESFPVVTRQPVAFKGEALLFCGFTFLLFVLSMLWVTHMLVLVNPPFSFVLTCFLLNDRCLFVTIFLLYFC